MTRKLLITMLFVLLLAACTAISGDATAEVTETQGVIVEGVPTLTVNHFAGNIAVKPGDDGKVTANLTKKSRLPDEAEAEAQLDNIVMSFSQRGTDVTLNVEGPENVVGMVNTPSADLELLVPAGATLFLNLGAGDITVEEPAGDVTINTGAGNSTVTLPAEASFRLRVSGGAITVNSEFEGVPGGGLATDINTTIGDDPTLTLTFNLGAGEVRLEKAD